MIFNEVYGTMPQSTFRTIRKCNVSLSDWDSMLARWGLDFHDEHKPWQAIEDHIWSHSRNGSYNYPMYG